MKDAVLSHEGVKSVQMVWNQHMLLGWLVTCESPRLSFRCYVSNGYNQAGEEASKEGAFTFHSKMENMITTFNKLKV